MLSPANLGGVNGLSELHRGHVAPGEERFRGTFVFQSQDDQAVESLAAQPRQIALETTFEGQALRLSVKIVGISPQGLAFFEGGRERVDGTAN